MSSQNTAKDSLHKLAPTGKSGVSKASLNVGLLTLEPLLFVVDGGGDVLNCSESVLRAFALDREQLIGENFCALLISFEPGWAANLPVGTPRILEGGYYMPWSPAVSGGIGWNVSAVSIDPDSNYATSLAFVPGPAPDMATPVSEDGLSGALGLALHELFLRAQQVDARFRAFLRILPGVTFVQGVDLGFSYRSSELRVLFGERDYHQLESCNWRDWLRLEDQEDFDKSVERCKGGRHPVSIRFRLDLPQKKKTLYLMEIRFPVRSVDGKLCGFEGLWLDLTPQKIAEKRLQEAAWKESLNEVSGSLTHDFNNILTGIINLADLMRPDYADKRDDGSTSNIDLLWESAKRAKDIVQRVVSLNRTQSGTVELLDLCDLIAHEHDLIRIVLPQRIDFSIKVPEIELPVRIDKVVICRILLNFATNARDAIADKGEAALTARIVDLKEYVRDDLFSSLCPYEGSGVELVFSDSGKGIAPQHIDRIFCPYFSTKDSASGTGLGLSSLSRYAMDNGFDFGVRSVLGQGTEMLLLLPLDYQQSASFLPTPAQVQSPADSRPPHDAALRVGVFAYDEKRADSMTACFVDDYDVSARVLGRGNSIKDWMVGDSELTQDYSAVSVICADSAASLSMELREFLLLRSGGAFRIAIVRDLDSAQSQAMHGELFDELLQTTNDPGLDVRNVLRCLRHSALFALKDFE